MFEFTQIGWFDPGSKRFCYTDEKEFHSARPSRFQSYTHPVFSIDPETASRLSVQLEPPKNDQPTKQGRLQDSAQISALFGKMRLRILNGSGDTELLNLISTAQKLLPC